jgi:hypothetical protein
MIGNRLSIHRVIPPKAGILRRKRTCADSNASASLMAEGSGRDAPRYRED